MTEKRGTRTVNKPKPQLAREQKEWRMQRGLTLSQHLLSNYIKEDLLERGKNRAEASKKAALKAEEFCNHREYKAIENSSGHFFQCVDCGKTK